MNRNAIRLLVILATISILGISIIQVYWFKQAFDFEEDRFTRDITASLHNVANSFFELNKAALPANNPIKQLSNGYYVVMINNEIDANLLEYLLRTEFEKRNINTDFEYGIYDCTSDEMVYGNYVSFSNKDETKPTELPKWENQAYYFGVNFPDKVTRMINRLDIWFFSSGVLLVVIIFFTYALFVILKQKRLSEIQKDFINNMTHEFKTPISTIALSTETLKEPDILTNPERFRNYTDLIEKENNRMKKQVERVLQIATMDRSKLELSKEIISIHDIIQSVIETFHPIFQTREASVVVDLRAEKDTVKGDRLHMTNVFYNLIDNAVKYCETNPEIRIETKTKGKKLSITIQDNGMGIEQKYKERIFSRFYRIPTGDIHNVKGFGLGLNYVRLVVAAHEGTVKVESEKGQGSKFSVELKLIT